MPGERTQQDGCSHLGLFGLPSVKTTPNRLKVINPGLIGQNESDFFCYFYRQFRPIQRTHHFILLCIACDSLVNMIKTKYYK